MTNSDLIAALSLAVTAIIFLIQTDDGLLKLKIRHWEKGLLGLVVVIIILLVNQEIFERLNTTFYFTVGNFYLKPAEWALLFFLFIICNALIRIFSPKIYNNNPQIILGLIEKYRAEKKWVKLYNLLLQVMKTKEFEDRYAEKLNDSIFNDHHFIEHFASDYPDILMLYSRNYRSASINRGEHWFYILNGLFADKSNPVFSEVRHYELEEKKHIFLDDFWGIKNTEFQYDPKSKHETNLPIISWLTSILRSYPANLRDETTIFFNQHRSASEEKNNDRIFSEKEIERTLSRDTVFNTLRLFRILLVELAFTDKRAPFLINGPLLLFYSAWDFAENSTYLKTDEVALNNDSYTINEYYLKYLFHGYMSLYILLRYVVSVSGDERNGRHEETVWIIQKLFAKLDSTIASNRISDHSKKYFIEAIVEFYFEIPEYFGDIGQKSVEKTGGSVLWQLKESLTQTPYGNVHEFRRIFRRVCEVHEFYRNNNDTNIQRAEYFYKYLLPHTEGLEDKICDI